MVFIQVAFSIQVLLKQVHIFFKGEPELVKLIGYHLEE